MKTSAVRDGDDWVLNGVKRWITNAGESEFYTVMAVTDPEKQTRGGISAFVVEKSDEGVSFGAPEKKLGIKGSPDPRGLPRQRPDPRRPDDRRGGQRLRDRHADPRPHPRHHRRPGRRRRPGCARLRARLRQGAPAVRQVDRRVPGPAVHARRHGHEGRGRPPDDLRRRRPLRARRRRPHVLRRRGQVLRLRRRDGGHHQRRAGARRLRLHPRLPGRADDARRQDHPDLRGHQPGPADRDGAPAARRGAVASSDPLDRSDT